MAKKTLEQLDKMRQENKDSFWEKYKGQEKDVYNAVKDYVSEEDLINFGWKGQKQNGTNIKKCN